jgi:hypothetical protein
MKLTILALKVSIIFSYDTAYALSFSKIFKAEVKQFLSLIQRARTRLSSVD